MRGEEAHAKVFLETVETQERNGALPYGVVKGYAFRLVSRRHPNTMGAMGEHKE